MLVYMFYFIPYYCMAIYGLVVPGCSWMLDWSMIHAGAAVQVSLKNIKYEIQVVVLLMQNLVARWPLQMRNPFCPEKL
jgi:hypothetical protein